MSRYIDADALKEWLDEYLSVFKKYDKGTIKGFVDHAPSIDIVFCKECRHWKKIIGMVGECESDYMWSTLSGEITEVSSIDRNGDDFCSYGERREP